MDFLWIYVEHLSYYHKTGLFNELEWSIKSVRKNYKGKANCFVVGDDPKLKDVTYIPAEHIGLTGRGYARHFDGINKLQTALPFLGPEFVMMYDDIYILHPITKEKLKKIYARSPVSDIEQYMRTRTGDTLYKNALKQTLYYIRDHMGRKDLYDWETHLPRYFVTEGIEFLIKECRLDWQVCFISSAYAAYYSGEPDLRWGEVQADIWTWTPSINLDEEFKKQFLNLADDALVNEMINKIKGCLN